MTIINTTLTTVIAGLVLLSNPSVAGVNDLVVETPREVKLLKEEVKLLAELRPICACESAGSKDATPKHYNKDGTVIKGKINKSDIGICQINLTYHGAEAKRLGLDLFKEEDNIKYANRLYRQQGSKPWSWSKSCHGK